MEYVVWLYLGMPAPTDLKVTSDGGGFSGFGAYFQGQWFSGVWSRSKVQKSIVYKELFPVAEASIISGPLWFWRHTLFCSDNEANVHMCSSRICKVPG